MSRSRRKTPIVGHTTCRSEREILAHTGISPGQLEIELTESAMMTDSEHSAHR